MSYRNGMGAAPVPGVAPIPDAWYQEKARELQRLAAATATSGLGQLPARSRGGVFSSDIFVGNRKGFYGLGTNGEGGSGSGSPDSAAPPPAGPPKVGLMIGWGVVLLATVGVFYATTTGMFTGKRVTANRRRRSSRRRSSRRRRTRRNTRRSQGGSGRRRTGHGTHVIGKRGNVWHVFRAPNLRKPLTWSLGYRTKADAQKAIVRQRLRRRRTTRRPRRNTRRRVTNNRLRRYRALSAAARKRMPDSSFALSGRRFPIKGPPGSSRERDKWQAMQAIRYLNMGRVKSRSDYLAVRSAIIREYGPNFWRQYDGPTWPKIQKAKRKRSASKRRRTSRRKMAANRRRTSRRR